MGQLNLTSVPYSGLSGRSHPLVWKVMGDLISSLTSRPPRFSKQAVYSESSSFSVVSVSPFTSIGWLSVVPCRYYRFYVLSPALSISGAPKRRKHWEHFIISLNAVFFFCWCSFLPWILRRALHSLYLVDTFIQSEVWQTRVSNWGLRALFKNSTVTSLSQTWDLNRQTSRWQAWCLDPLEPHCTHCGSRMSNSRLLITLPSSFSRIRPAELVPGGQPWDGQHKKERAAERPEDRPPGRRRGEEEGPQAQGTATQHHPEGCGGTRHVRDWEPEPHPRCVGRGVPKIETFPPVPGDGPHPKRCWAPSKL